MIAIRCSAWADRELGSPHRTLDIPMVWDGVGVGVGIRGVAFAGTGPIDSGKHYPEVCWTTA